MWFVIIVLDNAVYLFVWFFLSINGNGISFISVSVDENASTGEQAGRERLGFTSGDELAALSHAHRNRGPTEGQKTGSEVQSERDIKVPGHCLVHNCFFFFWSGCITFLCLQITCLCFYLKGVSFRLLGTQSLRFFILVKAEKSKSIAYLSCSVEF